MPSYAFGPFILNTEERELTRAGRPVALAPKAFETLRALVERAGRVVEKGELMRAVWPDAFVEEANLALNVFKLRKALGAGSGRRRYIETVPGRGYRFAAKVTRRDAGAEETAAKAKAPAAAAAPVAAVANAPTRGEIDSLAVLPLRHTGDDPEIEYLAEGIAENVLVALSRLPSLRVMARSTVVRLKDLDDDPVAAGRRLGVRAVLAGSVRQTGARLVVTAELVDTSDGARLWGSRYARPATDLLALQDEIAGDVAERLRSELTRAERRRLSRRHTESEAAYRLYLKGRHYWNHRSVDNLNRGLACFREAADLDPTFALTYVGLADCYDALTGFSAFSPAEGYPRAKAAVLRALEIDDTLAEAHASLAHLHLRYDWDWAAAGREFRRAIELNPNYAVAHHWYAVYLTAMGRHDEALAEGRRAHEIDPLSPVIGLYIGGHLFFARRYEEALAHFRRMAETESNTPLCQTFLAQAYAHRGMFEEAFAALREAQRLGGEKEYTPIRLMQGCYLAMAGRRREARAVLAEAGRRPAHEFVSPFDTALIHVALGQQEEALDWLEKSLEAREGNMIFLNVTPEFDALRGHARFTRLLERLGFTDAVHEAPRS